MNPFNKGTTSYIDFELMSDLKWHCSKCELKSGQAKTWQVWRQEKGVDLDKDEVGKWYKNIYCEACQSKTVHRKLKSTNLNFDTKARVGISSKLSKKVKEVYHYQEALFLRKLSSNELEVDHKFPQIRWSKNEDKVSDEVTEKQLKEKFILLTRANNLLKSRYCENCVLTGKRGCFHGIKFWHSGNESWDKKIPKDSEKGCIGCFWYAPYKWREELNKKVNNS